MKYIKLFEQKGFDKRYWSVKTIEPYLEISLEKIGMPKREIERFILRIRGNGYHNKYSNMYITSITYVNIDHNTPNQIWQLEFFKKNYKDQLEEKEYKFKGKVNVTPEDIEEWNIRNVANKYNL